MADYPHLKITPEMRCKLRLKIYEVDGGGETVHAITTSKAKARNLALGIMEGPFEIFALPMDCTLTIWLDKDGKISDGGTLTERTCSEWIMSQGEGLLCTTLI